MATVESEIQRLEKKCIKNDGDPRKNAKAEDLARLNQLKEFDPFDEADEIVKPPVEPQAKPQKVSFSQAWKNPNNVHLRKFTTLEAQPRIGLDDDGRGEAMKLIDQFSE